MENTFWTLIENAYYRVYNNKLKHAPLNQINQTIETSQESNVEVITPELLEKINKKLGYNFISEDFQ